MTDERLTTTVTFHDATDETANALADPVMAAKVAAVRAEMNRADADAQ